VCSGSNGGRARLRCVRFVATKLNEGLAAPAPAAGPALWERVSLRRLALGLIPFTIAFAVYLLVFLEMRPLGATGDEPHYLITAESIAYDLDVDLRNDYASSERVLRVVNVFPLGPHGSVYKESGELRPWRGVGLPALLAPGVGLGGLTGARLVMVLIAALLADQLYRLLRDLRLPRRYRIPAWVAVVFCLPILVFTSQIYPEIPGALLVVAAVRVMIAVARGAGPAALALGSGAAAALVWLHVRYLSLSLGILVGLAVAACVDRRDIGRGRGGLRGWIEQARSFVVRCAGILVKRWRTVTLPILAPYAVVLGLLAAAFQRWYGSPDPHTPYRPFGSPGLGGGGWDFWYEFAVRDIFDPIVGWIPFAPVHWLGLAALGCLVLRFGWPAAACVAVAASYVLVVASVGPNVGWGLPGRYPMIIVPLIAVPLAVGIQKVRAARVVFVPLLAVSLVFAVAAVRDYGLLYPAEVQRVFGMRSTATAFPVTTEPAPPQSFTLAPGDWPAPQTGRLELGQVVARAGRDRPGYLRYGPYSMLKSGAYRSTFSLAASGVRAEEAVAVIEVFGGGEAVLARETIPGRELRRRRLSGLDLTFATPGVQPIETRVYYLGRGTVRAGPIQVQRITVPTATTHFRDWPIAFLWVAGTFLVGWLFVEVMRLSRRTSA
jgi:hypothetical protein